MLGEKSQTKTNTMKYHLFVESKKKKNKKNQMNKIKQNRNSFIDIENKLVVIRDGGKMGKIHERH